MIEVVAPLLNFCQSAIDSSLWPLSKIGYGTKPVAGIWLGLVVGLGLSGAIIGNMNLDQVQAQTSASSSGQKPLIFNQAGLSAEIAEIKRTYSGQLGEYRQADQQFRVAQRQFFQLNTLAALETAVTESRQVMILRDQVLATYLEWLRLELTGATGVNLVHKKLALEKVVELQKATTRHREKVERVEDRFQLAEVMDDFEAWRFLFQPTTTFSVTILRLAKLQAIYDQTQGLYADLRDRVTQPSSSQAAVINQAKITRGLNEAELKLVDIQLAIEQVNHDLDEKLADQEVANITDDLNQIFVLINQSLILLNELVVNL